MKALQNSSPDPLQEFYLNPDLFEDERYIAEDPELQALQELGY